MIQDIKPYKGFSLYFNYYIEPRRIELAEMIANRSGKTTKITVTTEDEFSFMGLLNKIDTYAYTRRNRRCNVCSKPNCSSCDESDFYDEGR